MAKLNDLTDSEILMARQSAMSQACHDDKGEVPQEQTLKRAEAYLEFLLGKD